MQKTSLRRVGNSLGVTLPKAILEIYRLSEGDTLSLLTSKEGIVLMPFDPEFAEWTKAYEKTNKKFRNTLRALA